ncbi:MAG: hypothetical protein WAQ52_15875 [Terriglobales bacterium]
MPDSGVNALCPPPGAKRWSRIRKSGPFELRKIADHYPLYSRWLADKIQKLDKLPDFSEDERVFVMSDYGGEHKTAAFNTYAFLIASVDKLAVFKRETHALREAHGLNAPFNEFAYKKLGYGPIGRALTEYLRISDKYIHGVLVTISVEKCIPSLFGPQKRTAQQGIVDLLSANDLGNWGPHEAEKLLRVCHAIAMFLALLTHSGQKFLWMSDRDAITEDGGVRTFENTQRVFLHALRMYTDNEYEICGFAKPFEKDPFTSDLLSLADFGAGAIQDVLQSLKAGDVKDNMGKRQIIRWLGTSSPFLSKLNLVFKMDGGKMICGNVLLKAKNRRLAGQ